MRGHREYGIRRIIFRDDIVNRYYLTAAALISDSWIIRTGIVIGIVASMLLLLMNSILVLCMFAVFGSLGLGHAVSQYNLPERRILIGAMNQVASQTSIALAGMMWLVVVWAASIIHPHVYEIPGLALLAMTFAMWLGWGERLAFRLLCGVAALTFLVVVIPGLPFYLYNLFIEASPGMRTLTGFSLVVLSLLILYRYWTVSELDNPTQRPPMFGGWTQTAESPAAAASASSVGKPLKPSLPSESRVQELSWLSRITLATWGGVKLNRSGVLWTLLASSMVLSVAIYYRGNVKTTTGLLSCSVILLTLLPVALFSNRTQQTYRLLWVLGVGDERITTAQWQLFLVARRYLPWLLVIALILTVQTSASLTSVWLCLFTTLVSATLSGLMLWMVARWYRHWLRLADILRVLILGVFASVALVFLIWFFDELQPALPRFLIHIGMVGPLAVAILIAVAVWAWCIFHGAKGLSRTAIE